jgi:hypothetical protein
VQGHLIVGLQIDTFKCINLPSLRPLDSLAGKYVEFTSIPAVLLGHEPPPSWPNRTLDQNKVSQDGHPRRRVGELTYTVWHMIQIGYPYAANGKAVIARDADGVSLVVVRDLHFLQERGMNTQVSQSWSHFLRS